MKTYHTTVFRDPDRYAGWPANYGMWAWGNELVLVFTLGWPDTAGGFHARDRSKPFETMQARSTDGGENWKVIKAPLVGGLGLGAHEHLEKRVVDTFKTQSFQLPDRINFQHEDFAVMCGKTGLTAGAKSWFYTSNDRCESWNGPFDIPMLEQLGIAARTDWLIHGPECATVLLSATKPDGEEGRVFASRTEDGGGSFRFLSWINEYPAGFEIMPSSLQLEDDSILTAVRGRGIKQRDNWIDLYRSNDGAVSWQRIGKPVGDTGDGGNPPSLLRLADGRLILTYGLRRPPHGIFAIISEDQGDTWSDPFVIRSGAGNHDIGYTRSVLRADGAVVTCYYFNDEADGERYIAASITYC